MAVSKKDQLRVNLGVKRVERIKAQALVPWKARPEGEKYILYSPGQEKPAIYYPPKDPTAIIHAVPGMRTSESKLTIRRNGDNFNDYADAEPLSVARPERPKFATPNPASPFKRVKKDTLIVRV